ncbi:MAG: OmpA family protein [Cyclobacteriaceae bacterium]|nr:OmpA family protein [Cyclobacteriaceae bacterium]
MYNLSRILFVALVQLLIVAHPTVAQESQDKEQAKLYFEQAELILAETKAEDDARDLMVMAANYDTTFIKANFQAGHLYLKTIGKDLAVKYFLRVYRQGPSYRFDLEYWVAMSYQFGLDFDKAIDFYTRYKNKLAKKPNYPGKDRVDMKEVDRRIAECKNGKEFVANPKPYSIMNIGRDINSEFEDFAPILNATEDEIVFTTRRRDGNTYENVADDNKPYEDIFTTTRSGGNWQKAKNIGPTLNTKFFDSSLSFSPDGTTLFVYKDEGGGDIYFSKRKKDGSWSSLEALPGVINSSYRESSISITKDGELLYFASERPGGFGGSDIYVCSKDKNSGWSRVKNLGSSINTEYDEDGPFIDYDGKTLYFSSKGRNGMGGFDIFKSNLLNKEKNEWSEPESMGYPINSPDDDVFFTGTKDGKRWYYSSVRADGLGYSDIYKIEPPEEEKKTSPVAAKEPAPPVIKTPQVESVKKQIAEEVKPKVEPKPVEAPVQYVVNVVDADSKSPLDAKVRMQGLKDNVMVGVENLGGGSSKFSIVSNAPEGYRLSVEKEGYVFQTITLKIKGASAKEKTITKTIELTKLSVGVVSILRNIYFDFEKAIFKTEAYPELNKLETMMKQNTNLQVEIGGHTDSVGDKKFNLGLSSRRANAVKSFLTFKGVDTRRIKTVGYGETKPLASNDDEEEGRQFNRRVEFKVLGN